MMLINKLPNSWFTRVEQQSINGTPDCIGVIRGIFFGLEFKASSKAKVTALQLYNLEKIESAGGHGILVTPESWGVVYKALLNFAEGGDFQREETNH